MTFNGNTFMSMILILIFTAKDFFVTSDDCYESFKIFCQSDNPNATQCAQAAMVYYDNKNTAIPVIVVQYIVGIIAPVFTSKGILTPEGFCYVQVYGSNATIMDERYTEVYGKADKQKETECNAALKDFKDKDSIYYYAFFEKSYFSKDINEKDTTSPEAYCSNQASLQLWFSFDPLFNYRQIYNSEPIKPK